MYNHPKHKHLSGQVKGILINKSRSQNINRQIANEDNLNNEEKISKTAAYLEAKDVIRRIDNWALMQYRNNNSDDTRKKETEDKLSELKEGLNLAIEMVSENGIEIEFIDEIKKHRVFDEIEVNPYELQNLTSELREILKNYRK